MSETSPLATQMGSNTKRSTSIKKLIKTKSSVKNKRQLFGQLSFVEDHQETFYLGLNEDFMSACNPVQAKLINVDNAAELAKDWVLQSEFVKKIE